MQDHILLKDLPGLKAGLVARYYDGLTAYIVYTKQARLILIPELVQDNPEWFSELPANSVPQITETIQ
jgi:hypothetical protein